MSVPSSHFRFSFLLIITSIKKLSMKIGRVWKYFFGNIFLCWHFCVNGFFFFAKIIQQKWYKNESLWNLLVFMNFINKIPLCAYKNCYWRGNLYSCLEFLLRSSYLFVNFSEISMYFSPILLIKNLWNS